jgi:glucan 1,3-beta-glucosidase
MKNHPGLIFAFAVVSPLFTITTAFRNPARHIQPQTGFDYRGYHPSRQGSGHFGPLNRSLVPWEASGSPFDDAPLLSADMSNCHTSDSPKPDSFWLPNVPHQGTSPFLEDSSEYVVYRNVKDFGAKGDGSTDDSAAFNAAITRMFTSKLRSHSH